MQQPATSLSVAKCCSCECVLCAVCCVRVRDCFAAQLLLLSWHSQFFSLQRLLRVCLCMFESDGVLPECAQTYYSPIDALLLMAVFMLQTFTSTKATELLPQLRWILKSIKPKILSLVLFKSFAAHFLKMLITLFTCTQLNVIFKSFAKTLLLINACNLKNVALRLWSSRT